MFDKFKKAATSCFKPKTRGDGRTSSSNSSAFAGRRSSSSSVPQVPISGNLYPGDDPLLWSRDVQRHVFGDLSCAIMQANNPIEDYSLIEIGDEATFVGIFDGHGGPEAARYTAEHLFRNIMTHAGQRGEINQEVVERGIAQTEDEFLELAAHTHFLRPEIAASGTCVVIGVIWRKTLIIANLGDSRAVLATSDTTDPNSILARQLTDEHNAKEPIVRDQLRTDHIYNPDIVTLRDGVWRVKNLIQISRSIGDMYLKREGYTFDPNTHPRFYCSPIRFPVLSAVPDIITVDLEPKHQFLILASDGLWEFFQNQEAINFVAKRPREGIAKKLVMAAMEKVAVRLKGSCEALRDVGKGARRACHDDISVVVVFFNGVNFSADRASASSSAAVARHQPLCIRGFDDSLGPSNFYLMNLQQNQDRRQDQDQGDQGQGDQDQGDQDEGAFLFV